MEPTKRAWRNQMRGLHAAHLGEQRDVSKMLLDCLTHCVERLRQLVIFRPLKHEATFFIALEAWHAAHVSLYEPMVWQAQGRKIAELPVGFKPVDAALEHAGTELCVTPNASAEGLGGAPRVDAVLLPALAVDRTGTRLGQGGGWYDRALLGLISRNPEVPLIGCVPSYALLPAHTLLREAHDIPLTHFVTPFEWGAVKDN